MDIQQLCGLLQACVGTNSEEIKRADALLKQHEVERGFVFSLLRVSVEASLDVSIRQVAAITFKRVVERRWEPRDKDEESPLHPDDKNEVRNNFLAAIVQTPPLIQKQLMEVLKTIVSVDFPENWPGLKDAIMENLFAQDENKVFGAMQALRAIARKYEFKKQEERGVLDEVLAATLPKLLEVMRSIAINTNPAPMYAELQKVLCKIFWSLTYTTIPPILQVEANFDSLLESLLILVKKELPMAHLPASEADQDTWCWWKAKKWVLHITERIFKNYSQPDACKEENKPFAELYQKKCLVQMLQAHLQQLSTVMQLARPNDRVLNLCLKHMTLAVTHQEGFRVVKEHMKSMLMNVAFPLLCFSEEDEHLFREDPNEYIRKGYDIVEDIYSVKVAAVNFVFELCRTRSKLALPGLLQHIVGIMQQHQAALQPGNVPADIARKMDGALLAIGTLTDVLKKKKAYKADLEPMLIQHVMPCFNSAYGHLRARACWVAGMLVGIEFKEGGGTFNALFHQVVNCMKDAELPVRVDAVVALRSFVDVLEDLDQLKPILPNFLDEFFKLMNEVENEDMVFTLESIVEKLDDEIAPYADHLGKNLVAAFFKCVDANQEDEDGDDLGAIAAYGCLRALNTLVDSVRSQPAIFSQLEEICFPIMDRMTSREAIEVFEDVMEMVTLFMMFSPKITPRMWTLWPKMHESLMDWAIDYYEYMRVPFEMFISRATEVFLRSKEPNYLASVNQIIEYTMTGDFREVDIAPSFALMSVVLQTCRGHVDGCVGIYLTLCLKRLAAAESESTKVLVMLVVANALYYHPKLTVQALQQAGATQAVFNTWFEMILSGGQDEKEKHFKSMNKKKVCILGLCSLITLPDNEVPQELHNGLGQILAGIMKLLAAWRAQEETQGQEEDSSSSDEYLSDDDDDDDDDEEEEEEADGAGSGHDSDTLIRLEKDARRMLGLGADSDYSDDSDDDDEKNLETPLTGVDPFGVFADSMAMLEKTNPGRVQGFMSAADAGTQNAIRAMMELGAQRKVDGGRLNGNANAGGAQ
ncbi:unnamed protein product [Ostreobium quekettii]|uniref:Importin N-terminal domain-containing protein n=1 Tax=Ostreobium quekettii TaxID=121088 RepID=A0A8S1JFS9_9CHLO|nr:unnamed protein product [Ostreobium quekettii]|eukprot:evm.model.scf_1735.1 EVM.evm.TU.scf_1735.1   scf_1735:9722-21461(+)